MISLTNHFQVIVISLNQYQNSFHKDFTDSWLKIFKSRFIFLHSIWACQKLHWVTRLFSRYTSFKNLKVWLVESSFEHDPLKIYKPPLKFLKSLSLCQKYTLIHQFLLEISLFKNLGMWLTEGILNYTRLKIFKIKFLSSFNLPRIQRSPLIDPVALKI